MWKEEFCVIKFQSGIVILVYGSSEKNYIFECFLLRRLVFFIFKEFCENKKTLDLLNAWFYLQIHIAQVRKYENIEYVECFANIISIRLL